MGIRARPLRIKALSLSFALTASRVPRAGTLAFRRCCSSIQAVG